MCTTAEYQLTIRCLGLLQVEAPVHVLCCARRFVTCEMLTTLAVASPRLPA